MKVSIGWLSGEGSPVPERMFFCRGFGMARADLLEKLGPKVFIVLTCLPPTEREEARKSFEKPLSQLKDLVAVSAKPTGKLGKALLPFHDLGGFVRFEGQRHTLSGCRASGYPSLSVMAG